MILNYDSKEGFKTFGFVDYLRKILKTEQAVISDEVNKLFESTDPNEKLGNILSSIDYDSIKDPNFNAWLNELSESMTSTKMSALSASEAFDLYKNSIIASGKTISGFNKILQGAKGLLANLASGVINAAAMWAVSKAIEYAITKINEYINRTQILIDKGKEAQEAISDITKEYDSKKEFMDTSKDRIVELSLGVDAETNENISLTNEKYQEYLSLCDQLVELFPEVSNGVDSQGRSMINLGDSANSATEKLAELLDQERQLTDYKISQNLQTAFEGVIAQTQVLQESLTDTKQKISDLESIKNAVDNIGNGDMGSLGFDYNDSGNEYTVKLSYTVGNEEELENYEARYNSFMNALEESGLDTAENMFEDFNSNLTNDNGDSIVEWTGHIVNATEDQLDEFMNYYRGALKEYGVDVSEQLVDAYMLESQDEKEIKANWNSLLPSLLTAISVYDGYNDLSDNVKQAISNGINSIDPISEWMNEDGTWNAPENIRAYLREKFLDPFIDAASGSSPEFTKALDSLFNLDTSLSVSEYQDKTNEILQVIQKSFNDLYGADGAEKFNDFLITFGFKIVDENGNELDSTESMISEIKQRAFQKGENLGNGELLQSLTYEQLVKVHTTVVDSEYGGTIADAIKKETERQVEQIESEPITFSSLFTDSSGEQSEFSKSVDTFQEDISSIQESLGTLKEGENVSFIDLVQQFPQLSGEADNLSEALNNLKFEKLQSFSETWKTAVKDLDIDELKVANQYLRELLSTLDMSDTDISFGDISSRLLSDATTTLERADISNVLNKVWLEYGDTAEGRALIAKLSLETDAATWTFEEWVANIEDTKIKADLQLSEESIADLQKQLEMKQSEASVTQSEIDLKNAAGYRTTEEDYKSLIENGKEQIAIQDDIIKKRKKEQDNIKKVSQSTEQATAKYNELQKEIDSATSTLNDAYKNQIEWNTALDNLPITNAQSLSSAISNAMSEIDSSTGLTVDTVAALKEQFSELANVNVDKALYRTADGLKVDTNELERFTEAQNDAVMSQFESKIEAQRKAIEIYKATIGDNTTDSKLIKMQDDLESLLNRQAQYFAEYKNQMEQFTDYEDVQRAKNTENAGSHYDTMLSDLKTAKESYDKGLIGTDDFKSVAKYISPNGFDDFTNFAENYSKASRYLTEDSSGVINFLNDLQAKGYAAYQTLDDGSNQWIINIQDFADAAKDIGIGTDFFTDMFGKLEDYNIPNTFVSSVTEGELKIDDLTKQLVDAKVKLAELKAEGANTTVIDSQQRVVDELSTNLTNTQQSMNMFVESTKQNYVEGFSQVKDVISQLNDFRKSAQSEEEAQAYLDVIQEYADKYHLKLTADFEVDEASYQEQMDKMYVKSGSFENPIDPGFEKGSADAENYRSVLESVTKAHSENNKVLDESIKTLSKYDTETLKGINLNDGQYSAGLEDAERALDSLAKELGLTEEQAQMLATVLGSLGQTRGEVNVDYADLTEAINNLEEMQELGKIDETIDFKADLSELDSNELESYLERLKDVQVKLNPDTDEYDYVVQRIQDTEIYMTIKEAIENGSTVEELLNMSDEDLAKTCNINLNDDGASERLEVIKENLQEVNNGADVPITIRMDDTQFNQLLSDKNNDTSTITVDANNEPAKEKIDEAKDYADDQTGTMNIDGDKTLAINEANRTVSEINAKTATISIDGNLRLLSEKLTQELSKTRTINVSARVSGLPKAGEALGTAHASGTAVLDMWNGYRHSIGAYANGTSQNWALPRDEEALVNETGEPESIVRDGRWFLIPGGAHVEQLKKGDIIFNHKYKL